MNATPLTPVDRFVATLGVGAKQAAHLEWSRKRLFQDKIDARWVETLAERPELAERLEAFVSRYGRLHDTLADKLLPRWLLALAEKPGSQSATTPARALTCRPTSYRAISAEDAMLRRYFQSLYQRTMREAYGRATRGIVSQDCCQSP